MKNIPRFLLGGILVGMLSILQSCGKVTEINAPVESPASNSVSLNLDDITFVPFGAVSGEDIASTQLQKSPEGYNCENIDKNWVHPFTVPLNKNFCKTKQLGEYTYIYGILVGCAYESTQKLADFGILTHPEKGYVVLKSCGENNLDQPFISHEIPEEIHTQAMKGLKADEVVFPSESWEKYANTYNALLQHDYENSVLWVQSIFGHYDAKMSTLILE